ncbi:unnamed protein product, partial [Effrenium voratum]
GLGDSQAAAGGWSFEVRLDGYALLGNLPRETAQKAETLRQELRVLEDRIEELEAADGERIGEGSTAGCS